MDFDFYAVLSDGLLTESDYSSDIDASLEVSRGLLNFNLPEAVVSDVFTTMLNIGKGFMGFITGILKIG
jgi:hypothetical protein